MQQSSMPGYVFAILFLGALFAAVYLGPQLQRPQGPSTSPVMTLPARTPAPQPITADEAMKQISPTFLGEATFGPWKLICAEIEQGEGEGEGAGKQRQCRANHIIQTGDDKSLVVAGVNILKYAAAEQAQAVLFLRLPPQAQSGNVVFWVDENQRFQAPITRCTESQCIVQSVLPDAFIAQMKEGTTFSLLIPAPDNKRVKADAPLQGFNLAYEGLTKAVP